jgi:hypothetical protein
MSASLVAYWRELERCSCHVGVFIPVMKVLADRQCIGRGGFTSSDAVDDRCTR